MGEHLHIESVGKQQQRPKTSDQEKRAVSKRGFPRTFCMRLLYSEYNRKSGDRVQKGFQEATPLLLDMFP